MEKQICLNCGRKYARKHSAKCPSCGKDLGSLRVEGIVCYQICKRKECGDCSFSNFLDELGQARKEAKMSVAEIRDFEELEKALGELMLEKGTGPFHEEINYYNVLGLINSLKAGLNKDLDIVKQCKIYAERGRSKRILVNRDRVCYSFYRSLRQPTDHHLHSLWFCCQPTNYHVVGFEFACRWWCAFGKP